MYLMHIFKKYKNNILVSNELINHYSSVCEKSGNHQCKNIYYNGHGFFLYLHKIIV